MSLTHCPRCGAALPETGSADCLACHPLPVEPTPAAVALAAETAARVAAFREWHALLRALTPRALVTPLLVAVNVLVFVAMLVSGAHPFNPTVETLFAWGANFGPETTGGGFWRLLTSAFLHSGLAHLAFNMLCLYGVGRTTERMVGSPGFLLMYLTSAVAGSLASVAWSPSVVAVGASGAVFGTFGAFFGASLRAADTIPTPLLNWLRSTNGKFLAFNLVAGFFVPNVDVAAHVGGLAWGFVMGLLLGHPLRPEFAVRRRSRNLLAAGLFVPVFAAGLLAGGWRVGTADDALSEFGRIVEEEGRLLAIYNDASDRAAKGTLDDAGFVGVLDKDVLGQWERLGQRFNAVQGSRELNQPLMRKYGEYHSARGLAFKLYRQAVATGDGATFDQARTQMARSDRVVEEFNRMSGGTR